MVQRSESLTDIVAALKKREQTPLSLALKSLQRVGELRGLNAFVTVNEETVLSQAEAANTRRLANKPLSPIDGIPIAVKDNYLTRDYPTTACSDAMPLEPAGIDATVVANLRAAGAVIFGKTNMHEWAYGATNSTSNIGPTRNPHNLSHITGGSSGGSGAAVAGGIVPAALGSDTGGSVRIPSAACGIYGFKPSYGRASRHGILPLSWSLDAPGLMTTALRDILYLLPYFLGPDSKDPSTAHARSFARARHCQQPHLVSLIGPGLERSPVVEAAIDDALNKTTAIVARAELVDVDIYFSAWEAILHSEASSYHQSLLSKNPKGFSPITRAHLEAGHRISAPHLLKAQAIRARLLRHLLEELPAWDALVLPTLPVTAPLHGEDWQDFGGRRVTTQDSMTWFCWLGNLAGLPCLTLPVGLSDQGLPIGMMLMGRPGEDEALLALAEAIDEQLNGTV